MTKQEFMRVLEGLGPDKIAADVQTMYARCISTAIVVVQEAKPDLDGKMLARALNDPSYELMLMLFERDGLGGNRAAIKPRQIAREIETAISESNKTPRAHRATEDTLVLFKVLSSEANRVLRKIDNDDRFGRSFDSIVKSVTSAAQSLSELGLVELRDGKRGDQDVTLIVFTDLGREFMDLVLAHSTSASVDRIPASQFDTQSKSEGDNSV